MTAGRMLCCGGVILALASCDPGPSQSAEPDPFAPGVPLVLAEARAAVIGDLHYELELTLPEDPSGQMGGRVSARFELARVEGPLAFDFAGADDRLRGVRVGGKPVSAVADREHVIIPAESLAEGANEVELRFEPGNGPLNRRDGYLYALFVPARAREAFPCFDQPDLKARYRLILDMPAEWTALSNGAGEERTEQDGRAHVTFRWTEPISTYLFSFAAGEFQVEEGTAGGRRFRFLHRETDRQKVERNREAILQLHAGALDWLEEYTGIEYPFGKFDFALLPAFQYGGMEHPGSIFYRDTSLLLGPSPTQSELLGRASLISHETAHMWFGDLVTMRWFNDVWTKEVFANFMAAKIVEPAFPEVEHQLRFLLAHHSPAYDVDRSRGTHAIRQPLDNLNDAASLYGAIIYQKAPIVMKQLESIVGEGQFRDGIRRYLTDFSFGNATWPDLIAILDEASPLDLTGWSRRWVEEAGRPDVQTRIEQRDGRWVVELLQSDPLGRDRLWIQQLEPITIEDAGDDRFPVRLEGQTVEIGTFDERPIVLPDVSGLGYAGFQLDEHSRLALPGVVSGNFLPSVVRASGWLALWEEVVNGRLDPAVLMDAILTALPQEANELIAQHLLGRLQALYWRYLDADERREVAARVEATLWREVGRRAGESAQRAFFRSWQATVLSDAGAARLFRIWEGSETVSGLELERRDLTAMVVALAVRSYPGIEGIIDRELEQIVNPERRRRLEFLRPALAPEPALHAAFLQMLKDPSMRRREPWVLSGLSAIHHPLRAAESVALIGPALEMLTDVQATGDIFFPKRWTDSVLGGHSGAEAAGIVRDFLAAHPDYPARLKGKLLQSADPLFRTSGVQF